MPKVEQHTAVHLLEAEDTNGAGRIAVLDARMT
jgi:hypothetical protein